MLIGKTGQVKTAICKADRTSIMVRGYDLCEELMGKISFTEFFILHVTGKMPTTEQVFFMNAFLVSLAEHGLTPSTQAARMTFAAAPEAMQGAVAAGILGCGSVILGSAERAGHFICNGINVAQDDDLDLFEAASAMIRKLREANESIPGLGHPLHKPVDPRAVRLLELADERGASGKHVRFLNAMENAAKQIFNKPLPINLNGAVPAIALDIGFPISAFKGISILCRTAGLIGHLVEEMEHPIGFYMAHRGADSITNE